MYQLYISHNNNKYDLNISNNNNKYELNISKSAKSGEDGVFKQMPDYEKYGSNSDYFYFGYTALNDFDLGNLNWLIRRQDKKTSKITFISSITNPNFNTLDDAWTDKELNTITYN